MFAGKSYIVFPLVAIAMESQGILSEIRRGFGWSTGFFSQMRLLIFETTLDTHQLSNDIRHFISHSWLTYRHSDQITT